MKKYIILKKLDNRINYNFRHEVSSIPRTCTGDPALTKKTN